MDTDSLASYDNREELDSSSSRLDFFIQENSRLKSELKVKVVQVRNLSRELLGKFFL